MPGSSLASKAGTILSLPMSLLLVIFFFLPWLNVTCSMNKVASATGLQLSMGKITMAPMFANGPSSSGSPSGGAQQQQKDPQARPWFFLGLAIPAALLLVGAMDLMGRLSGGAVNGAILTLGAAGLVVLLLALGVDYGEEMNPDMSPPPTAGRSAASPGEAMGDAMARSMGDQMSRQMKSQIKTEATGVLVFAIVLGALLVCCPLVNWLVPRVLASLAPPQPPPAAPAQAPPPPGEPASPQAPTSG